MKKIIMLLGVLLMVFAFIAWINPSHSAKDYIKYVEKGEKGFSTKQVYENTSFHMALRTPSYLALKEMLEENKAHSSFKELRENYNNTSHYALRIQNDDGGSLLKSWANDLESYQQLIQYLAFEVKHDIKLMGTKDTFDCQFVHLERNFDLAPFAQLQIGFKTPEEINPMLQDDYWTIEFNAEQLGLGPLKFKFENSKLIRNPNISF